MINERLAEILVDSFWEILIPGLTMTIPLTVLSFSLAMVIAVITAMVQFADIGAHYSFDCSAQSPTLILVKYFKRYIVALTCLIDRHLIPPSGIAFSG